MVFAGINYWAVAIAAVVGYATGAAWYMSLSKHWMAAQGFTKDAVHANRSSVPFIVTLVANVIMAFMLAGVIGHLGDVTLRNGAIAGLLLAIDAGHWLLVLVLQGVVIGAWGVK
jgi:hypothetical protein